MIPHDNTKKCPCQFTQVIQRRTQGDVDFYRNWTDYKNGFGDLHGDFWTGNDIIHLLTNTPRVLRVELQTWDGTSVYAQYSLFQVANEEKNYTLTVQGFSGNVSYDAMTYHNGQSFTTYDSDNDLYHNNCASHRHGAWWYKSCCESNLNSRYQMDNGDNGESVFWRDLPPGRARAPLKMSKMMVR
ncbi:ficolin-1-like [Pecten maximus]|uniref:ficolin-1-like n=1 Tax=Pecten maximus TaxID=6579 RepID=UPI0014589993|nr:ficolin-1-like [Pecten maximus]